MTNKDIKPWDIKDPWIKTKMKDQLSRIREIKQKMFCYGK